MENNLYIAHYGILGQKWGVQNGPPYPLRLSKMTTSEKKAATKRTRARSAEEEAKSAHKLAGMYVSGMDKKAAKRRAQADEKPSARREARARRAEEEAAAGRKLAKSYTDSMDKKVSLRMKQADAAESRIKPSYKVDPKYVKKNMDSMNDKDLQKAINRINMQNQVNSMNPGYCERGRKTIRQYNNDTKLVRDAIGGSLALITTIALLNGVKLK